ncbi:MAG: ATP-binding cassette domain-containing protein [Limnohabitans sp.]|nr:ATP-binding cassette domain-containing protein [Limnohabitans sp.]
MSDLNIQGLHKYYGSNHVVKGIDLSIPAGEFTVLVGQSGCGKSTLLRTIAGLEYADQGSLSIAGQRVNEMQSKDRDIAMVFQNYALYPYMKVFDNIAFGLRARKIPAADIPAKVQRAADMLAISHLLDRYPRQLSGGQLQRVAIGRAVVRDARLYLFDEPLSNLDAQLRDEMRGEIKRLHQELGKTMIYVTHDQIEAMTLADRIVLMREGQIEQQGAPLELFEHPRTRYVAGFLGSPSMNFIPAVLQSDSSGLSAQIAPGLSLKLPPGRFGHFQAIAGMTIELGIRPEHMRRQGPAREDVAQVSVDIELVQPTGSRTFVEFKLGSYTTVAELLAHDVHRSGERLALDIDMNRVIVIDPATGLVIASGALV